MDVLTSETYWALNNEMNKSKWHQVGLSLFNYQDDARSNKHKIEKTTLQISLQNKRTREESWIGRVWEVQIIRSKNFIDMSWVYNSVASEGTIGW